MLRRENLAGFFKFVCFLVVVGIYFVERVFIFIYLFIWHNIYIVIQKICKENICTAPDKHSLYFLYTATLLTKET